MKLYYVKAEHGGENFDYLVVANDREEAIALWSKYETVADEELDPITDVDFVRVILSDVSPTPYAGDARVIPWEEVPTED